MKIDLLHGPPDDIFKDRRKYTLIFIALLIVSSCGLCFGAYALFGHTVYYEQFETLAFIFFVAPSPFAFYFGQKLQGYKKLSPPQYEELGNWIKRYPEIRNYCELIGKTGREPIQAEYNTCQDWVEKPDNT